MLYIISIFIENLYIQKKQCICIAITFNLLLRNFTSHQSYRFCQMTQKIRKRSFTNYQNSPQLQQTLLNQILEESSKEGNENNLPESQKSQKNYKNSSIGFIKSKKAKIFNKFQKLKQQTARQSTQNGNISTIASLKKQITALECDEIMSYRHNIKKIEENIPSQQTQKQESHSQISAILKKFERIKIQKMTDKSRRKFLLFSTMKIKPQMKNQQSSIKFQWNETQSEYIKSSRKRINLHLDLNLSTKNIRSANLKKQESLDHQRSRSSMSMTARKFYHRKDKQVKAMTQSRYNIYDRESSIKKIQIQKKTKKSISRSEITL